MEGYIAEKAILEESLQQKETQEERLVEELEDLKLKLHQMEGLTAELDSLRVKHQELSEEHATLLRLKEHLCAGLGEREKGEKHKARCVCLDKMLDVDLFLRLTLRLCNYYAQLCLLSVGHWLNLDPDSGLWVRVKSGGGNEYAVFLQCCVVSVCNTDIGSSF